MAKLAIGEDINFLCCPGFLIRGKMGGNLAMVKILIPLPTKKLIIPSFSFFYFMDAQNWNKCFYMHA